MRYATLKEEVHLLGLDDTLDNKTLFRISMNRALRDLYSIRTITRTVTLAATGLQPIAYYREISLPAGKSIEIPVKGKAYSMKAHGILTYLVRDGDDANAYSVNSPYETTVVKGFMNIGGSIMLWGDCAMSVYDLAIYDRTYTDKKEDIPVYGPTITYDLRRMYGDFMSFVSPAKSQEGKVIDGCRLYDGKLEVDSKYNGAITIAYRRLPKQVTADDLDAGKNPDIDIPEEYTHIFPFLVASYCFIESDEAKAKYFRNIFNESINRIDASGYEEIDYGYIDCNGWCK